ncbi:MAG: hypothetical protein LQ343_005452 [Gyalolechia ehrenbergii]|nr:MAG: hypothetical protein LQ343_005452 [Gyalolechia ehrenbergii]
MPTKHHILALLYNDFEALDLFGPLGSIVPRSDYYTLSLVNVHNLPTPHGLESTIKNGIGVVAHLSLAEALIRYGKSNDETGRSNDHFDTLFIPGGVGMLPLVWDPFLLRQIGRLVDLAANVFTVCTGSVLLAATGKLDGRKATTNKRIYDEHTTKYPTVNWRKQARWVHDGKYLTSSGVTAGIDAGFAFLSTTYVAPANRSPSPLSLQETGAEQESFSRNKARERGDATSIPGYDKEKALEHAHHVAYTLEYRWHEDPADDPFVKWPGVVEG